MTTNFKITSFTEIEFNGRHVDLHNNFSFVAHSVDNDNKTLTLRFDKASGDWVSRDEFNKLTFILTNVNYLQTVDPDPKNISDDHCVAGITYYDSVDRKENYNLTEKPTPDKDDDIIFTFESDRVIRANCDSVTLVAV